MTLQCLLCCQALHSPYFMYLLMIELPVLQTNAPFVILQGILHYSRLVLETGNKLKVSVMLVQVPISSSTTEEIICMQMW